MTGEKPRELAEAYSEALESQADSDEYDAVKDRRDAYRERLEKFENSYGDSDPATQELREKVQSAEDELSKLEQKRRKPEELEQDLLEAATGFMLDDEWLQPSVIEALNRALTGTAYPTLRIDDVELAEAQDARGLDDLAPYDIIDVVRRLAMDKLGDSDDMKRVWDSIEGTTKEGAFRVVARSGGATSEDVMASLDEDIEKKAAKSRLDNAVYQLDVNPYHREDGVFSLSTAGRYIAAEYAREADEQEASDGEDPYDMGQMRLGEEPKAANGGSTDE